MQPRSTRSRFVACSALSALALAAGGCGFPQGERLLSPTAVADRLQQALSVELTRVPKVSGIAAFPDVKATYAGRSSNERILVVVFDSAAATVQLVGERSPPGTGIDALRHRNVVVLYQPDPGTLTRASDLASALRSVAPTG